MEQTADEDAPVVLEDLPAVQPLHTVVLIEYFPAWQSVHTVADDSDVFPAAQSTQTVAPVPEYVPAVQTTHREAREAPAVAEYVPVAHD